MTDFVERYYISELGSHIHYINFPFKRSGETISRTSFIEENLYFMFSGKKLNMSFVFVHRSPFHRCQSSCSALAMIKMMKHKTKISDTTGTRIQIGKKINIPINHNIDFSACLFDFFINLTRQILHQLLYNKTKLLCRVLYRDS